MTQPFLDWEKCLCFTVAGVAESIVGSLIPQGCCDRTYYSQQHCSPTFD